LTRGKSEHILFSSKRRSYDLIYNLATYGEKFFLVFRVYILFEFLLDFGRATIKLPIKKLLNNRLGRIN